VGFAARAAKSSQASAMSRSRFLSATLLKLPTADTRQHYAGVFPQPLQKKFCSATSALHKPVPQLRHIFMKNITPKFHFGRQLSSLVAVSERR
jgi:hypothetical protein